MNQSYLDRLTKILALADSSHEGEATAAVRLAKQMLGQNGLSFADLARAAGQAPEQKRQNSAAKISATQVADLQLRIKQMQTTSNMQNRDLIQSKATVARLESALIKSREEVEKWRRLARDTANKLWDIGQQIEQDRVMTHSVVKKLQDIQPADRVRTANRVPPPAFSRERRFVRNSLIDTQEVEGRTATPRTAD